MVLVGTLLVILLVDDLCTQLDGVHDDGEVEERWRPGIREFSRRSIGKHWRRRLNIIL